MSPTMEKGCEDFMSNRDKAKQILDTLPDYKIDKILLILQGIQIDDEIEDDIFCENLTERYLRDDSSDKNDSISLEEFAEQENVKL
jgi:hypothetical protein